MTPVEKSERERQQFEKWWESIGELSRQWATAKQYSEAAFEAGRSAGSAGWISVKDRLPEPLEQVLVSVTRWVRSNSGKSVNPFDRWVQLASLRPDRIWIDDDSTIGGEPKNWQGEKRQVTHWMRKPGPIADKGDGNG